MAESNPISLADLSRKLPPEIRGWKKSTKSIFYSPLNLHEYINGGAELYISYNFHSLAAQTYTKEKQTEIQVDIFDMGSSFNAFGIFSHSRESLDRFVSPQVESEYSSGLLTFWKGRFYVSILAYPENEEKKELVQAIARFLADRVGEESRKPAMVDRLPAAGLVLESVRYFRHHIWLNSHFFISDQNILQITPAVEAVLAKYDLPEKTGALLLLLSYPDPTKAQNAYSQFLTAYLAGAKEGFKQMSDRTWSAAELNRNLLAIVFKAPALQTARDLLSRVTESMPK